MSEDAGNDATPSVPAPGPLASVDFSEPVAATILDAARQHVAMWGDAARALTRASDAAQAADRLVGSGPGALGAEYRPGGRRVLRLNEIPENEPLWIIGDVRGDVLALETALRFIDEASGRGAAPRIVFLGDLAAGTPGDAACVAAVLERFAAAPARTIVIAGDRELSLAAEPAVPRDARRPRTLADMPVEPAQRKSLQQLVRLLADLAAKLPVAAIGPDGLLLAHSAPPAADDLRGVRDALELEARSDLLRAFACNRLHPREARVLPAAGGAECAFDQSMRELHRVLAWPVTRLVRGHDAAPEGHRWLRAYGDGVVLTVSAMADPLPLTTGGRRAPCVARLKSGRLRVVRFAIPEELCIIAEQIFPRHAPPMADAPSAAVGAGAAPAMDERPSPASGAAAPTTPARAEPAVAGAPGDAQAERVHFERGVRLLAARSWSGARQAFQDAAMSAAGPRACLLNEAAACLCAGLPGHQDALRLLRGLLQEDAADADAQFNMGVTYLTNERNPIEAGRAFRAVTAARPEFADAWWALGLAASLRGDRRTAADAFARAAEQSCPFAPPSSMEGIIPARELAAAFDALRGRARCHPAPASPPVPLAEL